MLQRTIIFGVTSAFVFGLLAASFTVRDASLNAQPAPKKTRDEEEEPEKSKVPAKIDDKSPKDPASEVVRPQPVQSNFNIAQEAASIKKIPSSANSCAPACRPLRQSHFRRPAGPTRLG